MTCIVEGCEAEGIIHVRSLADPRAGASVWRPGDLSDLWPVDPTYFASKYQPSKRRHT